MIRLSIALVLVLLSSTAVAHRFSTSFIEVASGHDHPNEFDWSWRVVEHDLAVLAPFLVDAEQRLLGAELLVAQQPQFNAFMRSRLAFNDDCPLEVLPLVHAERSVYGGQDYIVLHGHGGCPLDQLTSVQINDIFSQIGDHKLIIEGVGSKAVVLSAQEPRWVAP